MPIVLFAHTGIVSGKSEIIDYQTYISNWVIVD